MREYNHIYKRRYISAINPDYLVTVPVQLPSWLYITISDSGDSKYVTVHSQIHVNKQVRINPSYSAEFSDTEILKDISREIAQKFL